MSNTNIPTPDALAAALRQSYGELIAAGETPARAHLAVQAALLDAVRSTLEDHGAPAQAYADIAGRFDRLAEGLGNGAS